MRGLMFYKVENESEISDENIKGMLDDEFKKIVDRLKFIINYRE